MRAAFSKQTVPALMAAAGMILLLPATIIAQTFGSADYLYRANEQAQPRHIAGSLAIDSAERLVTFNSASPKPHRGMRKPGHIEEPVTLSIKEDSITNAVYERTSTPRYAAGLFIAWPLLFTKEKKHFVTFQYKDASSDGKYAIFQLDKGNYREFLAATEAALGKKVERLDER